MNIDNAHIYAFAYQQGFKVPSESTIAKTVKKEMSGGEHTVHRLDRNPYQTIFRKQKKAMPKVIPKQIIKKKAFQVHSPEQIVMKCARQAYAR